MTTLEEIVEAFNAIGAAQERYRETLRAGLAAGVQQVEVSTALKRTRETIRRDAMDEQELAAAREADRIRKANRQTK